MLALGWIDPYHAHGAAPITGSASPALVAVIFAFPVAMALATGTEAPATSIAQLGQLDNRPSAFRPGHAGADDRHRRRADMGLTALAVHLHVGIPATTRRRSQSSPARRRETGIVRLLPGDQRAPPARSGRLVLSGRAGPAQGPRPHRAHGEEGFCRRSGRTNRAPHAVAAVGSMP